MILQNHGLPIPECFCDSPALFSIEYYAAEVIIHAVGPPEPERILRHHVELSSEHAERFAIDAMSMACCIDIRTSCGSPLACTVVDRAMTVSISRSGRSFGDQRNSPLWISEWIAKAAALMGSSPSTTWPSSFTRMLRISVSMSHC